MSESEHINFPELIEISYLRHEDGNLFRDMLHNRVSLDTALLNNGVKKFVGFELYGLLNFKRHYHNEAHVLRIFNDYIQYVREPHMISDAVFDRWIAQFAMAHDSVLVYSDNGSSTQGLSENLSAYIYEDVAENNGCAQKNAVALAIRATANHTMDQFWLPHFAKMCLDLDLVGLADDADSYDKTTAKVRKEFAHVSSKDFVTGRLVFLNAMLSRNKIYYLPMFADFEEKARNNMWREISVYHSWDTSNIEPTWLQQ